MGSYSTLFINSVPIIVEKSEPLYDFIDVFEREDFQVYRNNQEVNIIYPLYHDDFFEGEDSYRIILKQSINVIRDKLKIYGYSYNDSQSRFEQYKVKYIKELKGSGDEINDLQTKLIADVEQLNFAETISNIKRLVINKNSRNLSDLRFNDDLFKIASGDLKNLLISIIDELDGEIEIVYDFTEIYGEYYCNFDYSIEISYPFEDLVIQSDNSLDRVIKFGETIIVITEGISDYKILNECLELFYPHISECYRFFEYNNLKVPAGTGNIVNLVKSFINAGIQNNVIVIFDNDTAGEIAYNILMKVIPPNFRVCQYPNIELLNNYPTHGPTGLDLVNLNGKGGSLEFYLGTDCLTDSGELIPAQWTGYEAKLKKYQASITNKGLVQKNFQNKLKRCKKQLQDSNLDGDWSGIISIFQVIFKQFNN